jgi:hypothetical protein
MPLPRSSRERHFLLLALLACGMASAPVLAADPCDGFTWNVKQERALFGGTPQSLPAGKDGASAPRIKPQRLYELRLVPQEQVTFVAAPGKKMLTDGAYAGLVRMAVRTPGVYRVSADKEVWIDVAAGGKLVPSKDFRGQQGCHAPHKVVEFELSPAGQFTLQFSANTNGTVRVSVTRSPAPKS